MNRRRYICWIIIWISCLLFTGCWDQRLLRDHSLILSVGYDRGEDEEIINTIAYPIADEGGSGGGAATQGDSPLKKSKVVSVIGHTAKDAEKHMDKNIPEKFDRSKTRVIFFGKELAKEGIFSTLDSVYRGLRGPLNAKVAIFDGKAMDAMAVNTGQSILTSELYAQLLDSAEKAGITKNETVQEVCPVILTKGKDIILPYIGWKEKTKEAVVQGVALFTDDKMTGTLNVEETTILLILMDQITKNLSLNLKVSDEYKDPNKNFINMAIRKNKRELKVETDDDKVRVKIDVKMSVEVDEFAADHLYSTKKVKELSNKAEERLNDISKKTIATILEVNSDVLGIGNRVRAYHHDTWEKLDWKKSYPDISIDADFKVDIIRHGITN